MMLSVKKLYGIATRIVIRFTFMVLMFFALRRCHKTILAAMPNNK